MSHVDYLIACTNG